MELEKLNAQVEKVQVTDGDLSEQIKVATKESHVRANQTELMQAFQRGNISLMQYKLLLCSLYKIYEALEEELDRNASHQGVAPIYFPQELARLEALEKDLEHFYSQDWREQMVVPAATLNYVLRLREIGQDHPELLVAHAYTRYLGDLSGGQILSRVPQRSLGLENGEGLAFFSFPGVSSPNLFKQLYRSRMNCIELTKVQKQDVLEEAVRAFELNIEVFDELQNMLSTSEKDEIRRRRKADSVKIPDVPSSQSAVVVPSNVVYSSQILRTFLGMCLALAVSVGIYRL